MCVCVCAVYALYAVCVCMYVCVYVRSYACMYVCILYVWIYRLVFMYLCTSENITCIHYIIIVLLGLYSDTKFH